MQAQSVPCLLVKHFDQVLTGIIACLTIIQSLALEQFPQQLGPPTPPEDDHSVKRDMRRKRPVATQTMTGAQVIYTLGARAHQHVADCFLASVRPHVVKARE